GQRQHRGVGQPGPQRGLGGRLLDSGLSGRLVLAVPLGGPGAGVAKRQPASDQGEGGDGTLKRVKTRVRVEGSANIHDVAEATVLDKLGEKVAEPYLAGGSGLRQQHVGEPKGESAGPFPLGTFEEPYPLFPADGRINGQLAPDRKSVV